MKRNVDCVIFYLQSYGVGGLETATYNYICYLQSKEIPCICICDKSKYIAPEFRSVMNEEKITIKANNISLAELRHVVPNIDNPRITIISYHFDGFVWGERLKRRCTWAEIDNFYFLGHFCGHRLYFEDGFKNKLLKKHMIRLMKGTYSAIYNNGALRVFSKSHCDEVANRYKINIEFDSKLRVPDEKKCVDIDEQDISERYQRQRFNLLTVSRMEFPHKGYVLGLVAAYGRLKSKYPQMELTIVGDGPDMRQVVDAVQSLNESAKKDVHFIGMVAPNDLEKYYRDANLNISVAGCCSLGMRYGTLSAPARHYDYSGEVYGFLPEKKDMCTSCEPGIPCEQLIEETLRMGEEEYIRRCINGIEAYKEIPTYSSCDEIETNNKGRILTNSQEILLVVLYSFLQEKSLMEYRMKKMKEKGFIKFVLEKLRKL